MTAPIESCLLHSAEAEQAWIAQAVQDGVDRPRIAFIDYAGPTIIYGRSQVPGAEALQRARARGASVLQRRTGGGVVLAGPWMLGSALLLPPGAAFGRGGIVGAFTQAGEAWARALEALGIRCALATPEEMARHNDETARAGTRWVCFSGLSHGELLDAAGCKVLGLAQSRGKWGTLVSGGLVLREVPWELLGWVHLGAAGWTLAPAGSRGVDVDASLVREAVLGVLGEAFA